MHSLYAMKEQALKYSGLVASQAFCAPLYIVDGGLVGSKSQYESLVESQTKRATGTGIVRGLLKGRRHRLEPSS